MVLPRRPPPAASSPVFSSTTRRGSSPCRRSCMHDPWFQRGFSHRVAFSIPDDAAANEGELAMAFGAAEEGDKLERESPTKSSSSTFYNAIRADSAMSTGFNLSGLFEEPQSPQLKAVGGSVFTSRSPAAAIMGRLERVGWALGFGVRRGAKGGDDPNPYKLLLEVTEEGRKGRLVVTAEVFKVVPEVAMVEFSKSSSDTLEYVKFYEEDVRPGLKDIVWTWNGDGCGADTDATATNGSGFWRHMPPHLPGGRPSPATG